MRRLGLVTPAPADNCIPAPVLGRERDLGL